MNPSHNQPQAADRYMLIRRDGRVVIDLCMPDDETRQDAGKLQKFTRLLTDAGFELQERNWIPEDASREAEQAYRLIVPCDATTGLVRLPDKRHGHITFFHCDLLVTIIRGKHIHPPVIMIQSRAEAQRNMGHSSPGRLELTNLLHSIVSAAA